MICLLMLLAMELLQVHTIKKWRSAMVFRAII
jgi:hypothetical protein